MRSKLGVAMFDNSHSVTDITQLIAASIQKHPSSAVSTGRHKQSMSGKTIWLSISLRLEADFLHVMYVEHTQVLVVEMTNNIH
jgi:hypothetical protein